MNDFTKEELGYLYDELDANYSELKNIPLMNKVKSMIDNYCEHEELTQQMGNATYFKGVCKHCHKEKGF